MSRKQTSEQVQEEYVHILGPKLGPIHYALYDEVAWLHAKWRQYRILFAHSPERVQLLNRIAGFFFGMIQRVMWEDVLLHVARLTDRPQNGKKQHLTLKHLPEEIDDCDLKDRVAALVDAMMEKVEFARQRRVPRQLKLGLELHRHVGNVDRQAR